MGKFLKGVGICAGVVAVGAAAKIGYDIYCDKKRRDLDEEFLNDLDDDIDVDFYNDFDDEIDASSNESKEVKKTNENIESYSKQSKEIKSSETKTKNYKTSTSKNSKAATIKKSKDNNVNNKYTSLSCIDVIDCTANVYDVTTEDILSKSRKAEVANARRVAIYLCAEELKETNVVICEEFGGIGTTSVTNAKKNVSSSLKTDEELKNNIDEIKEEMIRLSGNMKL